MTATKEEAHVRRYWIALRGFDGHEVLAPNAAKAKAQTYRAWRDAGYGDRDHHCLDRPFKQFIDRIETFHALGVADSGAALSKADGSSLLGKE